MTASDIQVGDWVDRLLPAAARPYARLARWDRPTGTWLLLLPGWWSIPLGWSAAPETSAAEIPWLFLLFGIGALAMRGAGCTVNDLWDRDFDRKVARTATRPIASGAVSVKQALVFLVLQLLVGLAVLVQLNPLCWALGVGVLVLVFTYPLFKRVTYWPQFVLGLTFNWGALMGYAAVTGTLGWEAVALYVAGWFWTLGYDTIYAHQDKEDDVLIGVKSSALALGDRTRPFLYRMYGVTIALTGLSGWIAGLGPLFWLGLLIGAAHLAWQALSVDLDDPKACLATFKSNRDYGLLLVLVFLFG